MAQTPDRDARRPTGALSSTAGASRLNRWPFVDRTREAMEKGIAYIITGQHRRPCELSNDGHHSTTPSLAQDNDPTE